MESKFITPREAAVLLCCRQSTIEAALRNGTFPFGFAFCTTEPGRPGQWHYKIPRAALMAGISGKAKEAREIAESEARYA